MKISVVILTKNSQNTLNKTLDSVRDFDEIIIIDDYSTDKTLDIAKKYKAKIFENNLNNDFAAQRNFGLSKAKNNWVLFIDSDEYLSEKLVTEIKNLPENSKYDGFKIIRQEVWLGKKLEGGEWGSSKFVRFANKQKGKWKRAIHEYWDIKNISKLDNKVIHNPNNSIFNLVEKINKYSQVHASENISENKKSSLFSIIFIPIFKFKYNFFIKMGFRDGTHGFVYAILMSFHSFLSWSDIWLKQKK